MRKSKGSSAAAASKTPPAKQNNLFAFGFSSSAKKPEPAAAAAAAISVVVDDNDKYSSPVKRSSSSSSSSSSGATSGGAAADFKSSQSPPTLQTPNVANKTAAPVKLASPVVTLDEDEEEETPVKPLMASTATPTPTAPQKRRKIVVDSSSDEEEETAKPTKTTTTTTKRRQPAASGSEASAASSSESDDDLGSVVDGDDDDDDAPAASSKQPRGKLPAAKRAKPAAASSSSSSSAADNTKTGVLALGEHEHDLLPWFQPPGRRDINLNPSSSSVYDASTLHVPPGYINGQPQYHANNPRKITDAMRAWWSFYSRNSDCVLFYKVGKFYELYHQCADVGVKHCDLLYMRGDVAHCGFPEVAWSKNMTKLVSLNYRVCRIEQTETPAECAVRTGKKTGMVRREICQVLSPGTMTLQIRDEFAGGYDNHGRQGLLAISEDEQEIGLCLLDAATGKFQIGRIDRNENDGEWAVALRSVLALENAAELVYCESNLSADTMRILRGETQPLHSPVFEQSPVDVYFAKDDLPPVLLDMTKAERRALEYSLTVLKRALIDEEMVTMRRFSRYTVGTQKTTTQTTSATAAAPAAFLRLDNQCLFHLEIFCNNQDGKPAGSLFEYLDRTKSKFGSRMLREWVARPLASMPALLTRQKQVGALMAVLDCKQVGEFRRALAQSPDLERNLSKIHALGLKRKDTHPDSRAVIYSANDVNKAKVEAFCATLGSLRALQQTGRALCDELDNGDGDEFAHVRAAMASDQAEQALDHFERAFDAKQAKKLGAIEPRAGVAPEFDARQAEVDQAKAALQTYLSECKRDLACPTLVYFMPATGKNRYQLELPETKQVPRDWQLASKKKGWKRYVTPKIKSLLAELERCELSLQHASADVTRLVFAEFDKRRAEWSSLVCAAGELDCLLALAAVSALSTTPTCRPEFVKEEEADGTGAVLEITAGVHPCVAAALERQSKNSFIPNDVKLGSTNSGALMLLTGPNMGGKSTLLRQTCLLAIVAQLGCHVTASKYRATVVDAIFTRIGASDRILQGQSTFYVELNETATILSQATSRSLVILDELGRGTSSFDGTAIAHAVVERLVDMGSLCMFATHYHSLVRECSAEMPQGKVQLAHMVCDASGGKTESDEEESVMFLYKLAEGCSDRSYGLNVARLARLPAEVIQRAKARSVQFEHEFDLHMRARLLEEIEQCVAEEEGGGGGSSDRLQALLRRAKALTTAAAA